MTNFLILEGVTYLYKYGKNICCTLRSKETVAIHLSSLRFYQSFLWTSIAKSTFFFHILMDFLACFLFVNFINSLLLYVRVCICDLIRIYLLERPCEYFSKWSWKQAYLNQAALRLRLRFLHFFDVSLNIYFLEKCSRFSLVRACSSLCFPTLPYNFKIGYLITNSHKPVKKPHHERLFGGYREIKIFLVLFYFGALIEDTGWVKYEWGWSFANMWHELYSPFLALQNIKRIILTSVSWVGL